MTANCICPDVDVGLETIPSEPLKCSCCGAPLRITCVGECGEDHVRESFAAAAPTYPTARTTSAPAKPRGTWICGRCEGPIPIKRGRPPLYCEECLTPSEIQVRGAKRAANEAVRQKTAEHD